MRQARTASTRLSNGSSAFTPSIAAFSPLCRSPSRAPAPPALYAFFRRGGGIDDRTVGPRDRPVRQPRGLRAALHDVRDGGARHDQIVGDDAAVAAPPDGFRAHDRAAALAADVDQMRQSLSKRGAERIVGIIVEAGVGPEAVERARHLALASAQATE